MNVFEELFDGSSTLGVSTELYIDLCDYLNGDFVVSEERELQAEYERLKDSLGTEEGIKAVKDSYLDALEKAHASYLV